MKKIKIPETREAWLEQRRSGIGGSDAGAILGLNPYKSPYTLWAEKTGKISDEVPDNEAMRLGRDLEDYVAKRFCEATGKRVKRSGYSFQSEDRPFMLANVDRLVVGEKAGLECKTAHMLTNIAKNRKISNSYYCQCLHYMAVTGLRKWYIAVLIYGEDFFYETIDLDDPNPEVAKAVQEDLEALIEAEGEFWKCVRSNQPPLVDGSNSTSETLGDLWISNEELDIDLQVVSTAVHTYLRKKKELAALKEELALEENKIKEFMGESGKAHLDEVAKVSWKTSNSNRFNTTAFKKAEPELYQQYCSKSSSRRFIVKDMRGE